MEGLAKAIGSAGTPVGALAWRSGARRGRLRRYGRYRFYLELLVTLASQSLMASLKEATVLRNVICHGSWQSPDASDRSVPLSFNKEIEKFESPIDVAYLKQLQRHVAELAREVIDTVTMMGFQFPGTAHPQIAVGP